MNKSIFIFLLIFTIALRVFSQEEDEGHPEISRDLRRASSILYQCPHEERESVPLLVNKISILYSSREEREQRCESVPNDVFLDFSEDFLEHNFLGEGVFQFLRKGVLALQPCLF